MNTITKAGRPEVEAKAFKTSVSIPSELAARVEAYIARQAYPPAMSQVISKALELLLDVEKKGGKR